MATATERLWRVRKDHTWIDARLRDREETDGVELQFFYDGSLVFARRCPTRDEALADAMFLDVPARTAKRLLELAGEQDEFVLPLTQEELAAMVGASRERVNKAISAFIRLGWIEQLDRRYRITDREQLARRAT